MAKEQGLRSRAAFKLTQINRKFNILQNCQHGVLDLCAAPGGWTQIAARTCGSQIPIVAVDVLPIRPVAGKPNVLTIVGDITTEKCKADITRTLKQQQQQQQSNHRNKGSKASSSGGVDLVLHDGAPNVGADYSKDAYVQNELVVHAVKTATQHLQRGGTFITKVYRSRDYAALNWLLQQFWDEVTAFKPTASRPQSAEIFVVCQGYKAPAKIDPALLDPRRVFEAVAGDTATGGVSNNSNNNMTILHKNWDKHRRKRGGYDMEHLDFSMRHIEPVESFVQGNFKEAIQLLTASTGLVFQCEKCRVPTEDNQHDTGDNKGEATATPTCQCRFLLHHPLTTPEIKDCVSDLQLLNKSDFKGLLNWRSKMQDALAQEKEDDEDEKSKASNDDDAKSQQSGEPDSETEEAEIQAEIAKLRHRRLRERKRQTKKERAAASKRRKQAALSGGMSMDLLMPEDDQIFSLAQFRTAKELPSEVDLDQVTDEQLFGNGEKSGEDYQLGKMESSDSDDDDNEENEEARTLRRERDLEEAYDEYLSNTKDGLAKSGTKMAKRSKKVQRQKIVEEAQEDQEMALAGAEHVDHDARAYAKLLQRGQDDDDSDDDESSDEEDDDDDGFAADPMTPDEHRVKQLSKPKKQGTTTHLNPLLHQFADEPTSAKTARWFSNPLFANMGEATRAAAAGHEPVDEIDDSGSESDSGVGAAKKKRKVVREETKLEKNEKITAEDVLASMPKTDKQIRHDKRLKAMERDQRKKDRREKKLGVEEGEFQLVPANDSDDDDDDDNKNAENQKLEHLSEAQKKRVLEARELIKAGLGSSVATGQQDADDANKGFEIVSQEDTAGPLPVADTRKYDSDHEDYDSDDYAQTLALGTMLLRRSKEKAFVDASYNRYAWNDPEGLPDWFVDDESRHYRPQLPIPPALLAKMKEKMMALSSKPIAKVAEARARKSKRARVKLAAAKKQAEAVANSSEMSEAMKLKAISKALQGQDSKRPGKTYVVAKKGRGGKGVKGAKVVDKRLKADKKAMGRIEKKRKKGKQNGLVGSKRRRNHS